MATGGKSQELDSRVTCSVCLEPFSGRQPKLLPCFHTFCLPCLSELAEAAASQMTGLNVSGEERSTEITCPACRKVMPVPPGGVAHFQSNFYIDDEATHPQPSPCQLCDGDQEASYQCGKCGKFCVQCQRIHNRCCSSSVTAMVKTATKITGQSLAEKENLNNQVKAVSSTLEQLEKELKEASHQRQVAEEELKASYTKGLRLFAEAQEECLKSLRSAADTVEGRIQTEIDAMKETKAKLLRLSIQKRDGGEQDQEKDMVSGTELQRIKDCTKTRNSCWFLLEKNTEIHSSPYDCFKCFVGTVVLKEPDLKETVCAGVVTDKPSDSQVPVQSEDSTISAGVDSSGSQNDALSGILKEMENLSKKVMQYENKVARYENATIQLQSELSTVKQKNVQLSSELNAVQQKNARLSSDMSANKDTMKMLEREQTSLKDKNSLVSQDVAVLQAQNVAKLQKDFADFRKEVQSDRRGVKVQLDQSQLLSLQKSVDQHNKTLRTMESHFDKLKIQVAFQVLLHTKVKVKTERVLIMKEEVINIGGGYNTHTGYFTAPLSGVYLFIVTASSCGNKDLAQLDLVHENADMAYLSGEFGSSCHASFRVAAGGRVWLRTFQCDGHDKQFSFMAGWLTSFSGVLVQPDL